MIRSARGGDDTIIGPGRRIPWSGRRRQWAARRAEVADRQLLATGGDGLRQPVEQDLEAAEALVEEVLGLEAQPARIVVGGLHDVAGTLLGRPDDLGALHHPFGLATCRFEQFVGFAAGLGDELLAFLQHPAGLAQLVGQPGEGLLEQLDDLVAIDARRRRQRHRRRRGDDVDGPPQQRLGVADIPALLRSLGMVVVDVLVVVVVSIAEAVVVTHAISSSAGM